METPYADIADVENRLGYSLTEDEAQSVSLFLDDFSDYLKMTLLDYSIDPETVSDSTLTSITAAKGKNFFLTIDREPGVASYSNTVEDHSESKTFNSNAESVIALTDMDLVRLGIKSHLRTFSQFKISWT